MSARWDVCIAIPGNHSIHFVIKSSERAVLVTKNSPFCIQETCTEHVLISSEIQEPCREAQDKPKMQREAQDKPKMQKEAQDKPKTQREAQDKPKMQREAQDKPKMQIEAQDKPKMPIKHGVLPTAPPTIKHGLPPEVIAKLSNASSFTLPAPKVPLLDAILNSQVSFKGKGIISESDPSSLLGGHVRPEDNFLNNFVIDSYLKAIRAAKMDGVKLEVIPWEVFERASAGRLLTGRGNLLEQDLILVPCNPARSEHWFLVAVFPQQKVMSVLDSQHVLLIKLINTIK